MASFFMGKHIFVPATASLRDVVLAMAHTARHESVQKMLHHLCLDFYIPDDRALIQAFMRACVTVHWI